MATGRRGGLGGGGPVAEAARPAEGVTARERLRPGGAGGGGEKKAARRRLYGVTASSVSVATVEGGG